MVLRSAVHIVKGRGENRAKNAPPQVIQELPISLREEQILSYDVDMINLPNATISMILQAQEETGQKIGDFQNLRLEDLKLDPEAYKDTEKQQTLFRYISTNKNFLEVYTRLLNEVVVPHLDQRLDAVFETNQNAEETQTFWCQFPPTLRLQGGPSERYGRPHNDAEYGHQIGEVNFWLPLTEYSETRTALWIESQPGLEDFHPLDSKVGTMTAFHGTLCKHHAEANPTVYTRASLDFRVGVGKYFDPQWVLRGTKSDHGRIPIRGRRREPPVERAEAAEEVPLNPPQHDIPTDTCGDT